MNSSEKNVKVIRKHVVANKHQYTMYLNGEQVGILEMKKFFKSGGKQQNSYTFNYKSEVFDVSSLFFSNKTPKYLFLKSLKCEGLLSEPSSYYSY